MQTNCLITKLDEAVDNPNLPMLNTALITFSGEGNFTFYATHTDLSIISGDGVFTDSSYESIIGDGKNVTNATGQLYVKTTETSVVMVSNLQNMTYFSMSAASNPGSQISFDVNQLLQADPTMSRFSPGKTNEGVNGPNCTGTVTNLEINAPIIYFSGCGKLKGSMDNIVKTMDVSSADPIPVIAFYNTKLSFNTQSLEGKGNLYIYTNKYIQGDIKWFGHTKNHAVAFSTQGSNNLIGSVEDFVAQCVISGRTGASDYFDFRIRSGNTITNKNIYYALAPDGKLCNLYEDGYHIVRFTWEVSPTPNPTPGTGEEVIENPVTGIRNIIIHAPELRSSGGSVQ